MNPFQSRICEGPHVRADDPLPIHLRRYAMGSSKDPTGWNVGIVDGSIIGKASVLAGGIFHTEILVVRVLPPLEPNHLYTQSSAYVTSLIVNL